MNMSIADQLVHTTIRLECTSGSGQRTSGTGSIVEFSPDAQASIPAIVTNKHVVTGASLGVFSMTQRNEDGKPVKGALVTVPVADFEKHCIFHPEPAVDLAVFPLAPILRWLIGQNRPAFFIKIGVDLIANPAYMENLNAIESIIMVGYPNGLWDSENNYPMVRRGITATPCFIDFEGRAEFVIDCACFPGSSGSPVFLYDLGAYLTKDGSLAIGEGRVKLLGFLWGGPQHVAEGSINVVPVPTAAQQIALSRIPNNLGFCVKAHKLGWFRDHFRQIVSAQQAIQDASLVGSRV